ncbi:subtype A tannase [Rhodococcus sp. 14-2470-1a]|uniref:subtype A tannase n=1 Tax=Rhodococcus sp. 14-2470-1a TaxID=2023150 RepID=UPI000B9BE070|nr:subtype A tannase [Rhodococcus sp. 14-2470-1a]OZF42058.1 esterase [Rhodococcus sp. 14-2470-1a]
MTMILDRRAFLRGTMIVGLGVAFSAVACSSSSKTTVVTDPTLALDQAQWNYDSANDVYYQIGRQYVAKPQATDYETLGIYVPGQYFTGTENADGTYSVELNSAGAVGEFTAQTAPIVFPVNTPGYAAQTPPSEYSFDEVSAYMQAGFVYVAAGLRGKDSQTDTYTGNAPWGVVDLKSAVRFVKYNRGSIAGNVEQIFVFGHSGGGAQSAVMGASGDSDLYTPYLEALGAATTESDGSDISDAIAGVMAWCPITSLDYANASYEWNMGQFASSGTRADGTWTAAYSGDLANAFAEYQNGLALKNDAGEVLELTESDSGHFLSGTYYDHMISVVQTSLNDFLSYTAFPYTPNTQSMAGMGGSGDAPSGAAPQSGAAPTGEAPSSSGQTTTEASTTYATVAEYVAYLNQDSTWVDYDAATNSATVLTLGGFANSQKSASKDVGAFDGITSQQTENVVMGLGTEGRHFAQISRDVLADKESRYQGLKDWNDEYSYAAYDTALAEVDATGKDVTYRMNMYNPMYYLSQTYDGFGTSTVAPNWRIRTGIMQGDTASTTEVNLNLALRNKGIDNVDFATVWGLGHTQAETTGDAATNFIAWVTECVRS